MPFKIEHLEKGPPLPFAEYRYNQNSQIDSVFYNNSSYYITNYYNTRNWIIQSNSSSNNQFNYALEYYANGNISNQNINGDYKGNFSDTKEIRVSYTYDNSNRLTDAEPFSRQYFDLRGTYVYDADGNFSVLTRSYNGDGFNYEYYTGTNRLKKVTGESDQFTYDYNGNLTNDYFNNSTDIKYDHRNLITEITRINELEDPPATYTTTYKYDEGGNRINKKITKDDGSTMEIIVNEYYVRDVSGKEIAIYQNDTLKFWNVWGLGNEGRITPDGTRYYYIKDHLGSIRAVLNDSNNLVEAIDYDAWGYIARYWSSTTSKYKFTGKERDNETGYDYFGARFYDSRIGSWTSTDPLFEKHIQWSPYNYVLRNPMILIDPDGRQIYSIGNDKSADLQDLQKFIGSDAHRLSFDSEDIKKININTEGYTEGDNENLDLLIKMNNAFDEHRAQIKFGYEVFSDKLKVDLEGTSYGTIDSPAPYESSSITHRYTDPSMPHGSWPPSGFGGSVKVHIGLIFSFEGKEISRYQFVDHELLEVYERTVNKYDYFKAHKTANEKYFGGEKGRPLIMRLSDIKYKLDD